MGVVTIQPPRCCVCTQHHSAKAGVQHLARVLQSFEKTGILPPPQPSNAKQVEVRLTEEMVVQSFDDDDSVLLLLVTGAEQRMTAVKEALSIGKPIDQKSTPSNGGNAKGSGKSPGAGAAHVDDTKSGMVRILTRIGRQAKVDAAVLRDKQLLDEDKEARLLIRDCRLRRVGGLLSTNYRAVRRHAKPGVGERPLA